MAALDWRDLTRRDRISVRMVSPTDLDAELGVLEGVELAGTSLTGGYYTDTRTSGKLRVVGDGWVRGSFIRIIHEVPEWGYSNELGTFIVTDDGADRQNGVWVTDLTLQSLLFGLSTDVLVKPWVIASNAMMLRAARQDLDAASFRYDFTGASDHRIKGAKVMTAGTSRLSILYALAEMGGDRVDVDGHGRVTLRRYVAPASRASKFRIDLRDPRGVALDGLSRTSDFLELPDVVGVCHRFNATVGGKSVQREINASARVITGRGYTVTDFRELSEMSPQTSARAQALARQYLAADRIERVEWELTTVYLPIWEGDVVELVVDDGEEAYRGIRKCLVKNVELSLGDMTMKLTLKETASGDEED